MGEALQLFKVNSYQDWSQHQLLRNIFQAIFFASSASSYEPIFSVTIYAFTGIFLM